MMVSSLTLYLVLVSSFSIIASGKTLKNKTFQPPLRNATFEEKWQFYANFSKTQVSLALDQLLPYAIKTFFGMNITSQCVKDVFKVIRGIRNMESWAFKFFDSSGKIIDGMQYGSTSDLGSFYECLDTEVRQDGNGSLLFSGQYCSVDVTPALPPKTTFLKIKDTIPELKNFTLTDTIISDIAEKATLFYLYPPRIGVCIPSSCTLQDTNEMAKKFGDSFAVNITVDKCEVKKKFELTMLQLIALCICSLCVLLLILATTIDVVEMHLDSIIRSKALRVLQAFSLVKNFKKLTNTDNNKGTLTCVNGIRFLSMTWIILGHTFELISFRTYLDLNNLEKMGHNFAFQVVLNGSMAVETFFCMGGLLVSYVTIYIVQIEKYSFDVKFAIFKRLWRLLPIYAFVILCTFLADAIGSGPVWRDPGVSANCYENWYLNLLFINNFYHSDQMCIMHSWYLSCDFQLFVISLPVAYILLRSKKVGIILSIGLVIASVFYVGISTYTLDLPPTTLLYNLDPRDNIEFWRIMYFQPFAHVTPYFIGFIAGYYLVTKPNMKISALIQVIGWVLAFVMNVSVLYGVYPWNCGQEPTLLESVLYTSLNRVGWTLGLVWVIICCCTGHGGLVNYILSWKVFVPLSRLTYVVYLLHPGVIFIFSRSLRTQIQLDYYMIVWFYFGHLIVSYAVAFVVTMLIESPMMSLEKLMFEQQSRKPNSKSVVETNGHTMNDLNGKQKDFQESNGSQCGIDNPAFVYKF